VTIYTYILIAAVFIAAPLIVQATPRQDELLCEEVAAVLYEAVADGVISLAVADEVTNDCYHYFLPQ
jgi:hypothetical protein